MGCALRSEEPVTGTRRPQYGPANAGASPPPHLVRRAVLIVSDGSRDAVVATPSTPPEWILALPQGDYVRALRLLRAAPGGPESFSSGLLVYVLQAVGCFAGAEAVQIRRGEQMQARGNEARQTGLGQAWHRHLFVRASARSLAAGRAGSDLPLVRAPSIGREQACAVHCSLPRK
jgi:hypothetical protein